MCFSAQASIAAATGLSILSLIALMRIPSKSHLMLALTPLIFGIQQAAEAIVWLTAPQSWNQILASYTFLTFAMFVWPVWIPAALMLAEQNMYRKKILSLFVLAGVSWALFAALQVPHLDITTHVGEHIRYHILEAPLTNFTLTGLYVIPTTISFFFSSLPIAHIIGICMFVSCVATSYAYANSFISVWCFFAAIISCLVIIMINRLRTQAQQS